MLGDILKEIGEASLRVKETIVSVRSLFKDAKDQPAMISLEDVARQVLRLLQHELQQNEILVSTDFSVAAPFVHADPAQMQQVILNLLKNAIEAMASTPRSDRRLNVGTRIGHDRLVVLYIQDTGPGVPDQDGARIFEPFFTTSGRAWGWDWRSASRLSRGIKAVWSLVKRGRRDRHSKSYCRL